MPPEEKKPRQARHASLRVEQERLAGMLVYEKALWAQGMQRIVGVDEAGAGPWAGPVVAAAVVLPPGTSVAGIDDSKRLPARRRAALDAEIRHRAVGYAYGICTAAEVDALNILQACRQAMRRAVEALQGPGEHVLLGEHVLVDARTIPDIAIPQTALIKGDSRSQSIAAASILAKVKRDALMEAWAVRYPEYGFDTHRGYGTAAHAAALQRWGPCPIHRVSFAPVAAWYQKQGGRR